MLQIILVIINAIRVFLAETTEGFIGRSLSPVAANLVSEIIDISDYSKAANALQITHGEYRNLWNVVDKLEAEIKPIGFTLVITFFLVQIVGMASQDNSTLEHYIKEFIKLIIAVTIINKTWDIVIALVRAGDSIWYKAFKLEIDETTVTPVEPAGTAIGRIVAALIPYVIKKLSVIAVYVAVYMRALEIAWRTALFPIGVANMFDGGVNSPGVKYIKTYAGAIISGAVMVILIRLSPYFLGACYNIGATGLDSGDSGAKGMLALAAGELGIIGAVFGAGNKVKELFS